MCFDGGDSGSTSAGTASAKVDLSFTPTITIGSNPKEPAKDTTSTFAAQLLSAPAARVTLPQPVSAEPDNQMNKILLFVAVALVARKVLRG